MLKALLKWKKHAKDVRFVKFEHYKSQTPIDVRCALNTARPIYKHAQLIPPFKSYAMLKSIDPSSGTASLITEHVDELITVGEDTPKPSVYDKKPFPFVTVRPCTNSVNGEASSKFAPAIEPRGNSSYQAIPSYPVEYDEIDTPITLERKKHQTALYVKKELVFKRGKLFSRSANSELTKSLGIFSDTKMYSALIQSELQPYKLNIQHFNHPNSFTRNRYPLFDSVSAWIIYLSEKGSDEFLERFIERYFEKPTLFLFAKTKRITTSQKLKSFILDNDLVTNKYLYEDI